MKKLLLLPLAVLGVFLGGPAAQSAPPSPVGTWDCALGGRQLGLAIIRFDANFTFSGIQLIRPNFANVSANADINPRYPDGVPGRDGVETPPEASAPNTTEVIVGGEVLSGRWGYDSAGKVIGLLDQISSTVELVEKSLTNVVNGTNMVIVTNVYEVVLTTNAVGFRAVVVPGQRLTLTVFLARGQHIYRGLPSIPVANLSGELYGSGKRGNLQYFEFLSAMPTGDFPNEYYVAGEGPGYMYTGFAIVSRHKRVALYTETLNLPSVITTYSGPFDLAKRRGSIKGRDSNGKNPSYRLVHQ